MRPISFILCAAGAGTRMNQVSKNIQKSFISLQNKTLLQWSIEALDLQSQDQLIIVHRFEEAVQGIQQLLKKAYPQVKVNFLKLEHLTSGQAETAYLAKNLVLYPEIVIYNSDTYFKSPSLRKQIESFNFDGLIPCFKASGTSWSFCRIDSLKSPVHILEVTEKIRVSDWCSVGYYYFKSADDFYKAYEKTSLQSAEKYVAPLYNNLIENKKNICIVECDVFKPMGTPEQIQEFWNISIEELIKSQIKSN